MSSNEQNINDRQRKESSAMANLMELIKTPKVSDTCCMQGQVHVLYTYFMPVHQLQYTYCMYIMYIIHKKYILHTKAVHIMLYMFLYVLYYFIIHHMYVCTVHEDVWYIVHTYLYCTPILSVHVLNAELWSWRHPQSPLIGDVQFLYCTYTYSIYMYVM
jgi:hypothetical protein